MHNVISGQSFKYIRSSAFFVMMVLMPCLAFVFYRLADSQVSNAPADVTITGVQVLTGILDGGFVFVVSGILASLLICSDFTTQSIRQIIGKGTGRLSYTMGTLISVFLFCMIMILFYYLSLFGFATISFEKAGLDEWRTLLWLLLATAAMAFFYTAYLMFIACLTKRATITVPLAIVTPSLSELLVSSFATRSMKQYPIDPISVFNNIFLHDHKTCPRIYCAIAFIVAGIIFTILSIIVVKKKEY